MYKNNPQNFSQISKKLLKLSSFIRMNEKWEEKRCRRISLPSTTIDILDRGIQLSPSAKGKVSFIICPTIAMVIANCRSCHRSHLFWDSRTFKHAFCLTRFADSVLFCFLGKENTERYYSEFITLVVPRDCLQVLLC